MKTSFLLSIFIIVFHSCTNYRMLEGNSKAVKFAADNSIFSDSSFSEYVISYNDIGDLRGNFPTVVNLRQGEISKALIYKPTVFSIHDAFLVYPGEKIYVKRKEYNEFVFQVKNRRRNIELELFKEINNLRPSYLFHESENISIDSILVLENTYKPELVRLGIGYQNTVDSLLKKQRVSDRFKSLSKAYFKVNFLLNLYFFYIKHSDTLKAHGLFQEKLVSLVNNSSEGLRFSDFSINTALFNAIIEKTLPVNIYKLSNEIEFKLDFDFINKKIHGEIRDYLLSQLFYYAVKKNVRVVPDLWGQYDSLCHDLNLKRLVLKIYKQKNEFRDNQVVHKTDLLMSWNTKKITTIEDLINSSRGKIIVLDFWASWCSPCIREMPFLKKMIDEFKNVSFLSMSFDSEIQPWRKKVISEHLNKNNQYLIINSAKSEFVRNNAISEIPRIIIIGKDGKINLTVAPNPSQPEFKNVLKRLLEE